MLKKAAVTGSTGFLGKRIVKRLLEKGYTVYGLSRGAVKDPLLLKNRNFIQIKTDLRSFKSVRRALERIDDLRVVFHTATVHPAMNRKEMSGYMAANLTGTMNLLRACRQRDFKNIIASSSFSVYGRPDYLPVDEGHPAHPANFYALTKLQADLLLEFYARRMGFNVIILRYDGIYGIGQPISGFTEYLFESFSKGRDVELFNHGRQKRDNVYVEDAVNANMNAIKLVGKKRFALFNIGGGKPMTSLQRAHITKKAIGASSKIIVSKKRSSLIDYDVYLDIRKARKLLGYRPDKFGNNIRRMMAETRVHAKTV